jgi:hypothetical protein
MVTFQPDGKAALDAAYHNQPADAADLLEERADDHTVLVATAATVGVVGSESLSLRRRCCRGSSWVLRRCWYLSICRAWALP